MNNLTFNLLVEEQIERSRGVLVSKGVEYTGADDRFHNFKIAAELQGVTPMQALAGMMAKHTVSVYDLIDSNNTTLHTVEQWNEKITDHINYLLILRAMVEDDIHETVSD